MDKIISSILCCSFGSKSEQKSSSTTSSRDSSDINKITNKVDKSDETEEADYINNNDELATKSLNNKEMLNSANDSTITNNNNHLNTNKRNIIHQQPAPKSSIESGDSSEDSKSHSDSHKNHDIQIQSEKDSHQKEQQHQTTSPAPAAPSQQGQQQNNDAIDGDGVSLEYPEEPEFDLTAMQPGQRYSSSGWLLEKKSEKFRNKKCLILDLDETLVHSSFKYLRSADFVIPVEIEGQVHNVYVIKRPGVDEFMKRVGEIYEVVVFTASVSRYGDPLLDELDIHKSIHHRLFRDSCYNFQGNYIKNLSQIGRPLSDLIIIDNSPASYIFHPQHAVPISSWFSDAHDNELLDLLPFLEDLAKEDVDNVGLVLDVTM